MHFVITRMSIGERSEQTIHNAGPRASTQATNHPKAGGVTSMASRRSSILQPGKCPFCRTEYTYYSHPRGRTCQCHRYSRVFSQQSGLGFASQSTPLRQGPDLAVSFAPAPASPADTGVDFGTQTQSQSWKEALDSCVLALEAISLEPTSDVTSIEDADDEGDNSSVQPELSGLARSPSLGYIPTAFPQLQSAHPFLAKK